MDTYQVRDLLKKNNIQPTQIREKLLILFHKNKEPKKTEELHKLLEQQNISAHRATLYRDLKLFVEKKLIKQITLLGEHAELYTLSTEHTHHFKCTNCDNIQPFDSLQVEPSIEKFINKTAITKGWTDTSYTFKIYGFCKRCSKGKNRNE